jgi:hypothetical protein
MRMGTRCREAILALILLLVMLPASSFGAQVHFKSDTYLRGFQRDTATESDVTVLPGYEYLQLDAGELEDYGLSVHFYGWGRADLADSNYFDDSTDGKLLYGYLEYRQPANRFSVRFGRQYIFEGVSNEAVDGLRVSSDLGDYFSLSLYGGLPVALDAENGRSGDSIYGGRLSHHFGTKYEVGLSYKDIANDHDTAEKMVGVDLSAYLPANMSFYGYSAYNNETNGWAEHNYELRIPIASVQLKPYFQHFAYKDFFGTGANAVGPFRNLAKTDEALTAYGLDALWQVNSAWNLGAKAKYFDYDQKDNAATFSAQLAWHGEKSQYGGEIGRTVANKTAGNDYTLVRLFGYCEAMAGKYWLDFVSSDVLLAYYDEAIYGKDSSLFISLGTGKHLMNDALEVKISGDYSRDPYFDNDLKGMLTISYVYDHK